MSGTTCNLCVINENILYVTNIGDSRSALGFLDKNGKILNTNLRGVAYYILNL